MNNYILVILATILLAVDFAISKKFQSTEGTDFVPGLKYNALNGLFTAIVFWALSGFQFEFSWFSVILAFSMALCCAAYSLVGFRVLRAGNMAIYSLFLMSGGMLLPYFFGILFLEEELTIFRIIGVIVILLAVVISNKSKEKLPLAFLVLCMAVFALNGSVSIISKCHQINTTFAPVSSISFIMYSGIGRCLFSLAALLCMKGNGKPAAFSSKKVVLLIVASAFIGGLSYMFQLIGAKELPATVLYPMVTGGSIIFSAFAEKVFFKGKLTKYQIISVILCFIGTCFFL